MGDDCGTTTRQQRHNHVGETDGGLGEASVERKKQRRSVDEGAAYFMCVFVCSATCPTSFLNSGRCDWRGKRRRNKQEEKKYLPGLEQ